MNYNRLILAGRLTREPETRVVAGGTTLVNFGIANNRKVRSNGEYVDKVCFVDVTMFGKRAEAFVRFHHKGDSCLLEGHLEMDQWEDKTSGQKRSKLKMLAEEWTFTDGEKRAGGESGGDGDAERDRPKGSGGAVKSYRPPGLGEYPSADDTPF